MEKTRNIISSYKDESNGHFVEIILSEKEEEIIVEPGFYRAIWFKSGSGSLEIEGYKEKFTSNEFLFCTPYHYKKIYNLGSQIYVLLFSEEVLRSSGIDGGFFKVSPLFVDSTFDRTVQITDLHKEEFEYLIRKLIGETSYKDPYSGRIIGLTCSNILIQYLRLLYLQHDHIVNIMGRGQMCGVLEKFHMLVEDHYKTKHSVGEYVKLMDTSIVALSNAFRNLPTSPLKIIHNRILMQAKKLLTQSDLSIKQIAFELGFNEPTRFYQFFKSQMDMTPKEFRTNNER